MVKKKKNQKLQWIFYKKMDFKDWVKLIKIKWNQGIFIPCQNVTIYIL